MKKDPEDNRKEKILWERYRDGSRPGAASPCPDADSLVFYLDGTASGRTVRKIEEHLAGCPSCLAELKELRSLLVPEPVRVPDRVRERAKELVPSRRKAGVILPLSAIFWRRAVGWAVAAACVAAASAAGMELGSRAVIDRTGIASEADPVFPLPPGLFDL